VRRLWTLPRSSAPAPSPATARPSGTFDAPPHAMCHASPSTAPTPPTPLPAPSLPPPLPSPLPAHTEAKPARPRNGSGLPPRSARAGASDTDAPAVSPVPRADVAGVSPVPRADVAGVSPVPRADVAGVSPVPVQDVAGVSPVPVQMWQRRVPAVVQVDLAHQDVRARARRVGGKHGVQDAHRALLVPAAERSAWRLCVRACAPASALGSRA
jgi:hypothetical protein